MIGEHIDEILKEAGYTGKDIELPSGAGGLMLRPPVRALPGEAVPAPTGGITLELMMASAAAMSAASQVEPRQAELSLAAISWWARMRRPLPFAALLRRNNSHNINVRSRHDKARDAYHVVDFDGHCSVSFRNNR